MVGRDEPVDELPVGAMAKVCYVASESPQWSRPVDGRTTCACFQCDRPDRARVMGQIEPQWSG
jgi:hypothetical protein